MGFHSEPAIGSRFWFRLPLQAAEATAPLPAVQSHALAPPTPIWRLLIVDDHPVNRLLLRQVLLSQWPEIYIFDAAGGWEALEIMQTQAIDLVLMDMVMPEMDGIETTRAIRSQAMDLAKPTPILGLTANIHPPDLADFEAAGLNAVMLKPFDRERLLQQVRELLS
jgi:CheY-like chemotaxis protein